MREAAISTRSVLLISHGSANNAKAAAWAHAIRLTASGRYAGVEVGFLRGKPTIAEALGALPDGEVLALPLALSDGHVVGNLVPKALSKASDRTHVVRTLPPAGTAALLPQLVAAHAKAAAAKAGLDPTTTGLLLVAHGGGTGESRENAWRMAAALDGATPFHVVATAFLEESPGIVETALRIGGSFAAIGLFAERGDHVMRDVEGALDQARRRLGTTIVDAGPIGASPAYFDAIEEILANA